MSVGDYDEAFNLPSDDALLPSLKFCKPLPYLLALKQGSLLSKIRRLR